VDAAGRKALAGGLHDRMTESVLTDPAEGEALFSHAQPAPLETVPVLKQGKAALEEANQRLGLALSADEIDYLVENFQRLERIRRMWN
jgi:phosphoribosylformylglycinamidine synthase